MHPTSSKRMGVYQALTPQFKRLADEYGVDDVIRSLRRVGGELEKVMIDLEIARQVRQNRYSYAVNVR